MAAVAAPQSPRSPATTTAWISSSVFFFGGGDGGGGAYVLSTASGSGFENAPGGGGRPVRWETTRSSTGPVSVFAASTWAKRSPTTLASVAKHGNHALPAWKSNLQPDFNVSVIDRFGASSSALLRELDESDRFVQKSAKTTSILPS